MRGYKSVIILCVYLTVMIPWKIINAQQTPKDITDAPSAVAFQHQAVADLVELFRNLIQDDNAALQALDEERYADWDRYWLETYPQLVARLEELVEAFELSEMLIQDTVFAQRPSDVPLAQFVPLPLVLLAVAVITTIYLKEQERVREVGTSATQDDIDTFINQRTMYWQKQKGLTQVQARTRAIAEAGQIEALKGLAVGIEHARTLAVDVSKTTPLGKLTGKRGKSDISISSQIQNAKTAGKNIYVIMTSKLCETSDTMQRRTTSTNDTIWRGTTGVDDGDGSCQVYLGEISDDVISNVPIGEWRTSLFPPEHIRAEEETIAVVLPEVDGELVPASDVDPPNDGEDTFAGVWTCPVNGTLIIVQDGNMIEATYEGPGAWGEGGRQGGFATGTVTGRTMVQERIQWGDGTYSRHDATLADDGESFQGNWQWIDSDGSSKGRGSWGCNR